jgi:hypothetical protein
MGVALALPEQTHALEVARAIDAEQVTAGFLDFRGRTCVALPADRAHVEQTAHCVAKVVHLLLELHTDFINEQSDACPLPEMADRDAEVAANALLDVIGAFGAALAGWRRVRAPPDELQGIVAEGMAFVRDMLNDSDGRE